MNGGIVKRRKKHSDMVFEPAPDILKTLKKIVYKIGFSHINPARIVCFRSHGSVSRARARIWSLPRVWQMALNVEPHYVIEVLSEKFDRMSTDDQTRVLIHELMHIPKNFSGALVPHRSRFHAIDHHTVEKHFKAYRRLT